VKLLIASILPIVFAPLVWRVVVKHRCLSGVLEGFVIVSVGGIVLLQIIPSVIAQAGLIAVVAGALGMTIPWFIERLDRRRAVVGGPRSMWISSLGMLALALHGMLDGAALAAAEIEPAHGLALALAVLVHRLPEALAIWWIAAPRLGKTTAGVISVALVLATLLGYGVVVEHHDIIGSGWWVLLQAALVGSLLHILAHRSAGSESLVRTTGLRNVAVMFGVVAAIALLWLTDHIESASRPNTEIGPLVLLVSLLRESSPAVLLGLAMSALTHALRPRQVRDWLNRGTSAVQAIKGALIGLPLNLCTCGLAPFYRGLVRSGVSRRAALAFLVSSPECGVLTVFLSASLMGWRFACIRVAAAIVLAITVSLIVTRVVPARGLDVASVLTFPRYKTAASWRARWQDMVSEFTESADHALPWILLGVIVASLLEPAIGPAMFSSVRPALQVPLAGLAGIPMYVCASGSTPLVAILVHKGLGPGAALAFLMTGPATNVITWGVVAQLHGRRAAWAFTLSSSFVAVLLALLCEGLFRVGAPIRVELHQLAKEDHGAWSWISLAVLFGVVLLSLARQGLAGFVQKLINVTGGSYANEHDATPKDARSDVAPEAPSALASDDTASDLYRYRILGCREDDVSESPSAGAT
jgi:uncharacterized protein